MLIEYDAENVFTKQIEIADIGNCALRCTAADFCEYYILVRTVFGKTFILKYGPFIPEVADFSDFFNLSYQKFDFKETKIEKAITSLVNDEKKAITEIEEVTIEEALQDFPSIAEIFMTIGEV